MCHEIGKYFINVLHFIGYQVRWWQKIKWHDPFVRLSHKSVLLNVTICQISNTNEKNQPSPKKKNFYSLWSLPNILYD